MNFRVLLESLKWLPASDVLQAGAVARFWHSAAESEEVWSSLLFDRSEGLLEPATLNLFPTSKALFQALHTYHHIAVVCKSIYAQFNIQTKSTEYIELATPTTITRASYLLFLPDTSLFACGGDINSLSYYDSGLTSAYRILPIQWTVCALPAMACRRRYPGAYYYKGNVYVFGGSDETLYLASAELFAVARKEWRNLPDAQVGRNSFTPVRFGLEIYLVGGSKTNTIEAFHMEKRVYRSVPVQLPGRVDCTSVVSGSILHAFTMQQALTIDLVTEKIGGSRRIPSNGYVWSNGQPLIYKNQVWFYYWHVEAIVSYDFGAKFVQHKSFEFSALDRNS